LTLAVCDLADRGERLTNARGELVDTLVGCFEMVEEFHNPDMPSLGTFGKGYNAQHVLYRCGQLRSKNSPMPTRTNLRQLREQRNLSQTALADMIGTTLNMYGKLERGQRRMNMDWLTRLASSLDVRVEDIVAEVEPETAAPGLPEPTLEALQAMLAEHYRGVFGEEMEPEMLSDLSERMLDSVENWKVDPVAAIDPQVAQSVARQINRLFDR